MATVDVAVLEAMAQVHQRSLSTIQIAAEAAAIDAWYSLDGFDDEAEEQWSIMFWLISSAAAGAVAGATWSYLSSLNAYVGISAVLPQPSLDWFRADFDGWDHSPIVRSRSLVSAGAEAQAAIDEAGAQVNKLMSAATRQVEQNAFAEVVASPEWTITWEFGETIPDDPIVAPNVESVERYARQAAQDGYPTTKRSASAVRWQRRVQVGSCGWCRVVADRPYSDQAKDRSPLGAWHTFCRCTWRMLTPKESKEWKPELADDWRTVITERATVPEAASKSVENLSGEPVSV